jgi:hypothetical protein
MKALLSIFRFEAGKTAYSSWEWTAMRCLLSVTLFFTFRLAGYNALAWGTSPGRSGWKTSPDSLRGLAQFFDINWVSDPTYVPWMCGSIAFGLLLLILGYLPVLAAGILLLNLSLIGSLENSASSNVFHTSQILGFVLIGIVLGCLYRPKTGILQAKLAAEDSSRVIYTVQQMVAAAYVVAAVSKLWRSKGTWISQSSNIHLQFLKNQRQDYYETLQLTDTNWAVEFVMQHPAWAKLMLAGGLFLELFAFLALWNRKLALIVGLGLIGMHSMISRIMLLDFDLNVYVVAIFFVNVPYWIWRRCHRRPMPA